MATHEFLRSSRGRMKDSLLVLKAKGTVATSMVGESPLGTDTYIDTGGGRTRGDMVINVYDFSHSTLATSKLITFRLQGSKNTSFTTGCDLVITEIGKANMLTGASSLATDNLLEGRYVIPFSNDFDGTAYRYLRHYVTLGTNSGLQYDCYLSKIYS
jgi:hypothetical protein